MSRKMFGGWDFAPEPKSGGGAHIAPHPLLFMGRGREGRGRREGKGNWLSRTLAALILERRQCCKLILHSRLHPLQWRQNDSVMREVTYKQYCSGITQSNIINEINTDSCPCIKTMPHWETGRWVTNIHCQSHKMLNWHWIQQRCKF